MSSHELRTEHGAVRIDRSTRDEVHVTASGTLHASMRLEEVLRGAADEVAIRWDGEAVVAVDPELDEAIDRLLRARGCVLFDLRPSWAA
jgi:hypothetical protein